MWLFANPRYDKFSSRLNTPAGSSSSILLLIFKFVKCTSSLNAAGWIFAILLSFKFNFFSRVVNSKVGFLISEIWFVAKSISSTLINDLNWVGYKSSMLFSQRFNRFSVFVSKNKFSGKCVMEFIERFIVLIIARFLKAAGCICTIWFDCIYNSRSLSRWRNSSAGIPTISLLFKYKTWQLPKESKAKGWIFASSFFDRIRVSIAAVFSKSCWGIDDNRLSSRSRCFRYVKYLNAFGWSLRILFVFKSILLSIVQLRRRYPSIW